MGSLESKHCEELSEYIHLCNLLNETVARDKYGETMDYEHFESLKRNPRIEWRDYRYQLRRGKYNE